MKRLLLISPWFGPFPEWINFFVESCRWNTDIDWLIPTDQVEPVNRAPNVRFMSVAFDDYKELMSSKLSVDLTHISAYKLCDVRPFLGVIFLSELEGYRSFGYCDLDVIWGDIRQIYTDEMLDRYEAISSHSDRMAGHFAVFQNTEKMRQFGNRINNWRELIAFDKHLGLDEGALTRLVKPKAHRLIRRFLAPKSLLVERYTTPDAGIGYWPDGLGSPQIWSWRNGRLTNERFSSGILYLHFMTWHSSRWRRPHAGPAPWVGLEKIVQCDWAVATKQGFSVSPAGIRLLDKA